MPSTPYAKLLVSLNGGAPQSGGITAANGDTVALTAESTAQWDLDTPPKWEIYSYPDGWTGPASGWTTESVAQPFGGTADIFVYYGLGPPPSFTLPALPLWGKFLFRLTVQGGILNGRNNPTLIDDTTALSVESPSGLIDTATLEGTQFSQSRAWSDAQQKNLRVLDALVIGGGGTVTNVSGTAPINVVNGTSMPVVSITAATTLAAGSMSAADKTLINGATNAATASTLVKRDASGNAALNTLFTGTVDTPGTDLVLAADSTITITLDITTTNEVLVSNAVQAPAFKTLAAITGLVRSLPLNWRGFHIAGAESWETTATGTTKQAVVDATAECYVQVNLPHGVQVTNMYFKTKGAGAGPVPGNLPSYSFVRQHMGTLAQTIIGTATDAGGATYRGSSHYTTVPCTNPATNVIDRANYRYYALVTPEYGTDSVIGLQFDSLSVELTFPAGFSVVPGMG